jgi:hypothetical protein
MGREFIPFDKLFASDRKDSFRARIEAREDPLPNLTPRQDAGNPQFPSPDALPAAVAPATEIEARIAERKLVSIRAEIKESGSGKYQIWVVDLSKTGFRIKLLTTLEPTRTQFLLLPGFQPLAAHIAWREGDEYGLRFDKSLHIAVFEHIANTFPGLTR